MDRRDSAGGGGPERLERRTRTEHALRAGEERFDAPVRFPFDVHWEASAEHRFRRQEPFERLTDAPRGIRAVGLIESCRFPVSADPMKPCWHTGE
jgi:hypothetical protein